VIPAVAEPAQSS